MGDGVTSKRRGFLAALGLGGAAAAAGTAEAANPSRADALPPGVARQKETAQQRTAARYRETDHVRAFYATNRY